MLTMPCLIITSIFSTAILFAVYIYLYINERKNYIKYWAISWLYYMIKDILTLFMKGNTYDNILISIGNMAFILSSYYMLRGTYEFLGKKLNKGWIRYIVFLFVWVIAGGIMKLDFTIYSIPVYFFMGAVYILTGIAFMKAKGYVNYGNKVVGTILSIYGLHKLDYPFLGNVSWFISYGYMISVYLQYFAAVSILAVFFQSMRNEAIAEKERAEAGEKRLNKIVTDQKEMMGELKEKKEVEKNLDIERTYFKQLFEDSPEAIAIIGMDEKIISLNKSFQNLFQYNIEEAVGKDIRDLIVPKEIESLSLDTFDFQNDEKVVKVESIRRKKDGSLINVSILRYPVIYENVRTGVFAIYTDISERIDFEEKLRFASMYDSLTGVYNRSYFESYINKLERNNVPNIGVVMCDLDGLKFINDTLGHGFGDKMLINAAEILKMCCDKEHITARVGGDEFIVLVTNGDTNYLEKISGNIKYLADKYNEGYTEDNIMMSISTGIDCRCNFSKSIHDVIREADNNMYMDKLQRKQSSRNSLAQALMKALEEKNYITEGHSQRIISYADKISSKLNLSSQIRNEISLLAQFHDIGKVGIPDDILNKNGKLTEAEKTIMKRHCEIGYRIARASTELQPIADFILKHHEWWNGEGYPIGLKGKDIPLQSRIISVVDAYDEMTSGRQYRKAMSNEEAEAELKKFSGIQFDPDIVKVFLSIIDEEAAIK